MMSTRALKALVRIDEDGLVDWSKLISDPAVHFDLMEENVY